MSTATAAYNPDVPEDDSLERAIAGALRATIRDHGPITAERIGSAAKRVAGNLKNARLDGIAAALGRRGGLAAKKAGANFAKLGGKGGRAGRGVPKPRSPEAQRRMLARRLLRAAGAAGEVDAAAMKKLATDRPALHVPMRLEIAARELGVEAEVRQLERAKPASRR